MYYSFDIGSHEVKYRSRQLARSKPRLRVVCLYAQYLLVRIPASPSALDSPSVNGRGENGYPN